MSVVCCRGGKVSATHLLVGGKDSRNERTRTDASMRKSYVEWSAIGTVKSCNTKYASPMYAPAAFAVRVWMCQVVSVWRDRSQGMQCTRQRDGGCLSDTHTKGTKTRRRTVMKVISAGPILCASPKAKLAATSPPMPPSTLERP